MELTSLDRYQLQLADVFPEFVRRRRRLRLLFVLPYIVGLALYPVLGYEPTVRVAVLVWVGRSLIVLVQQRQNINWVKEVSVYRNSFVYELREQTGLKWKSLGSHATATCTVDDRKYRILVPFVRKPRDAAARAIRSKDDIVSLQSTADLVTFVHGRK